MEYDCPQCGNKRTRSVVAIYESGTKRSRGKAGNIRFGANGRVSVSGGSLSTVSTSLLVERLNPPLEPSNTDYSGWIGLTVIGLIGIIIWLLIESFNGPSFKLNNKILFISLLYTAASVALWWFIINRDKDRVSNETYQYTLDYKCWSSLWYCSKCGNVYIPNET